jgi:LPXTG-motif cell wall-anchored protein
VSAVRRRSRLPLIATAVTLIAGLSLLGNTAFAASNPPGNNGTVKIHNVPLDSRPHNQPHVGCPFTVTFFGFDEGDVAQVLFTAWAPTGKGKTLLTDTVDIGADDNSGGGSQAGFDGEKTYTLDFDGIVPHEQQGFHVKLTVTVTSPGSKTPKFNKYKVFWAQPCVSESSTSSSSTSSSSTTTSTTTPGGGTSSSVSSTSTSLGGGVGGTVTSGAKGRGALAFTGSNSLPMMIVGLALLALGAASLVASRRQRNSGA